jgi:gliding motility-associated protein GldL
MGFVEFLFETKKGKKMMGMLYGWGASIVIVGALFKIMHWPGAGAMLTVGLLTEAVIFFFSAFEPPHIEVDWTLVYPELAGMGDEISLLDNNGEEEQGTITEQLDNMLEEAKIGPELIESLGEGLKKMAENASNMSDLSGAAAATSDYASSMQNASSKVNELADSYVKASESLTGLVVNAEDGRSYSENLQNVSKNLSALNNMYELQLQSVNEHMTSTNEMYSGIQNLMESLNSSVEGTQQYRENISELAKNLGSLNRVYGNMLTAMNANPNQG